MGLRIASDQVYFLEDAKVKVTMPKDTVMELSLAKGQTLLTKEVDHLIENVRNTEFHSLLIELNE